jgi:hypothetical protein
VKNGIGLKFVFDLCCMVCPFCCFVGVVGGS